jgi:CRISPR-associated endonuclease Csn1
MMPRAKENGPYVLGLDLGVQSIGWAIMDLDSRGQPHGVRRAGVRCFDSGVGSEKEIEQGKDESTNVKRRQARQTRRQLWRRARRLRTVFGVLQRAGLLPQGPAALSEQRHAILADLDRQLRAEHGLASTRVDAHLLPYHLRAKALDGPLSLHALGRAFYHLAQRRGFLSNKKARKDSEDEGEVKTGIAELQKAIDETGARTLGEYFAGLDPEESRIRGRWTARQMYLDEFEKIWDSQSAHHKALTEALKRRLHRAVFFQRPLKSQKGLVGKCTLEPGCRRAPIASLDAQRLRYLQKVNDLEIIAPDGQILPLTEEQRAVLIQALEDNGELTFGAMRGLLGLKKPKGAEHGYAFNLETGGEKRLIGNRTAEKLSKVLGKRWINLVEGDRQRLVEEMLAFEKEEALARRLQKAWGFEPALASQLAGLSFEPGYSALSHRAIEKLLPRLQAGVRLNTAKTELYADRLAEKTVYEALPPVLKAVPSLRNPVVCRALTELRKVVNALVREYGKPSLVRIELARDMKRGREARKRATDQMRQQEKLRLAAKKRILAETGVREPSPGDILKVLLAEECNWECPYTGKPICMEALVGRAPQFDIEHILPFSRSLDNSFLNKTLCYHEENRNVKQNRTPWEAYGGSPDRWQAILHRVRRFRGDGAEAKLRRFQMQEIPEDFVTRQLNDTRYISRLAADYVGLLFGGRIDDNGRLRVQVSAGRTTAYLRDAWGLNSLLGDGGVKDRSDHRHHAVDAVVIALTAPGTVQTLSRAAARAEELGRRLFVPVDAPWRTFPEEVRRAIEEINVSYRVDRRVSGALHEESFYSPAFQTVEKGKTVEYRHVRKPLAKMSASEVEAIVDEAVRKCVQARLEQLGGDPEKAFADPANHPYRMSRDGRLIPIHKARIRRKVAVIPAGRDGRQRHVAPGTNHHIEIVATLDEQGRDKAWEGVLVNLFEAARRAYAGEPVIRRNHGPGKEFRFSLAGGEYVEMEHEPGKRQLYRVTVITNGQLEFRLHTDARPITLLKKTRGARVRRSLGKLLEVKARKVVIDPLGNILPAHD